MSALEQQTSTARATSAAWLGEFARALGQADAAAVDALFMEDAWWRDLLAFTGDLRTFRGGSAIRSALLSSVQAARSSGYRLTETRESDLLTSDGVAVLVAFFDFETTVARGSGVLRLKETGDGWKAWSLLTALDELKGFEETTGTRRPRGNETGAQSWHQRRSARRSAAESDPEVVVIGAGQNGLAIAARLHQLGVGTLVVDRNDRLGDNWRHRYDSLVLHDPVWFDHLPYLPFPPQW